MTVWLNSGAQVSANEQAQAEQDNIVLGYRYHQFNNEPFNVEDGSLLTVKKAVKLTRAELEATAKSVLGIGSENNEVNVGLFTHQTGGKGLPLMTKAIATLNHENGEVTPALDKPAFSVVGWQWLPVTDTGDKYVAVQYLGNGGTRSNIEKIQCQATTDPVSGGRLYLTPNILNGQGLTPRELYKFIQGYNAQKIVRKSGYALETSSSSQRRNLHTEDFYLVCRYDQANHSYYVGDYTPQDDQMGFQARVNVTIKHARGTQRYTNVWAYPKMYLLKDNTASGGPARYRDIKIGDAGNGGIKFKPKFEVLWSINAQHRGTGGFRYHVHCGEWEEGDVDQYGDVDIIWGPGLDVEFEDAGCVVDVEVLELWAVTDTGEKLLTPDQDGFYQLDDPTGYVPRSATPGTSTGSIQKWTTASYLAGRVGVNNPSTWAMKVNGDKGQTNFFTRASYIDPPGDEIYTPVTAGTAPEKALLAPVIKFTNLNPTVKDVAIVVRNTSDSVSLRVSKGRVEQVSFIGYHGLDIAEVTTFEQVSDLPPLATAEQENVSVTWHVETDEITIRPGEVLGIDVANLPNSSVNSGEHSYFTRVYLPFQFEG